MQKQTQADHVTEEVGFKEEIIKEKVVFPGIQTLHEKPLAEIAEALAMTLKSRNNIKEIRYRIGEYIEVTTQA